MTTKSFTPDPQDKTPVAALKSKAEKTAKTLMVIFACVLAVVVIVFVYLWIDRAKMIGELTEDKLTLELNLEQLRSDYDELQTSNDTLNVRLIEEREKVDILIDRLKKTEATDRAQIRQYEKELGLLREIMRGYVRQIDSLNVLNQQLRAETVLAKNEAQESNRKYENLVKHADTLTAQVEKGSVVKVRDIAVIAITKKGKETNRRRNTVQIKTCFTLIENSIAPRGFRNVYVRVKGPDKIVLAQADNNYFTIDGEQLIYSAVREIDYQGNDLEVCIFYGGSGEKFTKGEYTVDVYSGGALVATGQVLLR
jgi:hypothetical protein